MKFKLKDDEATEIIEVETSVTAQGVVVKLNGYNVLSITSEGLYRVPGTYKINVPTDCYGRIKDITEEEDF